MARQKIILLSVFFSLCVLAYSGLLFYTEVAWYRETGYFFVYRTLLLTQIFLFFVFTFVFFTFSYANYAVAVKVLENRGYTFDEIRNLYATENLRAFLRTTAQVVFLLFGIMFAFDAAARGNSFLLFAHPQPFSMADPVFHKDVSFYIFRLPFLRYVIFSALFLFSLNFLVAAFLYFYTVGGRLFNNRTGNVLYLQFPRPAKIHLHALGSLFLTFTAISVRLQTYEILFSKRGVVSGAGYADVHGTLPFLNVFVFLTFSLALLCIINIFLDKVRLLFAALILCAIFYAAGSGYSGFIQQMVVLPSELEKEKPFMQNNMSFTRFGFNLDNMQEHYLNVKDTNISGEKYKGNAALDQTRLWDYDVLLKSFTQLQAVRLYYKFLNVDVDRYVINDKAYQVMLAAREFSDDNLESRAKTWVNRHIKYTHGYGVSMVYADRFTKEGLPEFIVSNIPPHSPFFTFKNPRIYFGENFSSYAIVHSTEPEFDYPGKEKNVEVTYEGSAGIPLSNVFAKAAFALKLADMKLFISSYINSRSRILLYRDIRTRVRRLAPFLSYDADPYIVALPDRFYWLMDAYTTTSYLPYSERLNVPLHGNQPAYLRVNYIRNSVKITVDAYEGKVNFYVADTHDPIIAAYGKIYPGMFKPLSEMPAELQAHLRYPEGLFSVQSEMFSVYHMKNTETFYNKEDVWQIAQESSEEGNQQSMEPYYVLGTLPGAAKKEYLLMLPFTPSKRDNMIAWLAGRCDESQKCSLVLYRFPRQRAIYGPAQIEARINQDQEISKLLTLWSQHGSNVKRGNLLVIPTPSMLYYVKPFYLLAESSALPELKMVVLSNGKYLAMGNSLKNAFENLLRVAAEDEGGKTQTAKSESMPPNGKFLPLSSDSLQNLFSLYDRMQRTLKEGDLETFGKLFKEYGGVLKSLQKSEKGAEK